MQLQKNLSGVVGWWLFAVGVIGLTGGVLHQTLVADLDRASWKMVQGEVVSSRLAVEAWPGSTSTFAWRVQHVVKVGGRNLLIDSPTVYSDRGSAQLAAIQTAGTTMQARIDPDQPNRAELPVASSWPQGLLASTLTALGSVGLLGATYRRVARA